MKFLSKLVLALTFAVAIIAASFSVPKIFGINPYVILSGSMEPGIPTGSVVYIDTHDKDVHEGDIIAFQSGSGKGAMVTHRAVKINEDGTITTKGDNNEVEDLAPLSPEYVVGKYTFHIPKLGAIMNELDSKKKIVIAAFLILANIAMFGLEVLFDYDEDEEILIIQISNDSGDDDDDEADDRKEDTEKDTISEEGTEAASDPEPETE